MPGGDRSGPRGLGSMTGRGAGYCSGANQPGFANQYRGYGMGSGGRFCGWGGRGGGRGWRNQFWATGLPGWTRYGGVPQTAEQEMDVLKNQAGLLKDQLEQIQKRLEELEDK